MDIEALGFQGGGIKGLAYIGALKQLQEYGLDMNKIKRFAGTSAGSQIATLLAVGYDIEELEAIFSNIPFHKYNDGSFGIFRNIHRILWSYGYNKGTFMKDFIDRLITDKLGNNKTTFLDLYEKKKVILRITGTCLTTRELEYFDYKLSPHMPICKAVQISSCVPLFYAAVKYNGKYYVDGAVLRNLPIKAFPENKTLFFRFKENKYDKNDGKKPIKNILQFVYSIIDTTSKYCNDLAITDAMHTLHSNIRMIEIDTYMVKATDFAISAKTKNFLVKQGGHAVSDYINKIWLERLYTENKLQRYIQQELVNGCKMELGSQDNGSFVEDGSNSMVDEEEIQEEHEPNTDLEEALFYAHAQKAHRKSLIFGQINDHTKKEDETTENNFSIDNESDDNSPKKFNPFKLKYILLFVKLFGLINFSSKLLNHSSRFKSSAEIKCLL
jgi:NTE family protein